jgi:hypothetical protein
MFLGCGIYSYGMTGTLCVLIGRIGSYPCKSYMIYHFLTGIDCTDEDVQGDPEEITKGLCLLGI